MTGPLIGIAFPFRIVQGGVQRSVGFEKLEQNLMHLLSTRLRERVMLRNYGAGVHHRLQEPNDAPLRALIRYEIEQALRIFMPEVRLTAPIRLVPDEAQLTIFIEYQANPQDIVRRLEIRL
jgi:phage baseplate assembly protein W